MAFNPHSPLASAAGSEQRAQLRHSGKLSQFTNNAWMPGMLCWPQVEHRRKGRVKIKTFGVSAKIFLAARFMLGGDRVRSPALQTSRCYLGLSRYVLSITTCWRSDAREQTRSRMKSRCPHKSTAVFSLCDDTICWSLLRYVSEAPARGMSGGPVARHLILIGFRCWQRPARTGGPLMKSLKANELTCFVSEQWSFGQRPRVPKKKCARRSRDIIPTMLHIAADATAKKRLNPSPCEMLFCPRHDSKRLVARFGVASYSRAVYRHAAQPCCLSKVTHAFQLWGRGGRRPS